MARAQARRGSLSIDPQVLAAARTRARRLGMPFAHYVAALVRNELIRRDARRELADVDGGGKRVPMSLSLPVRLRKAAGQRAGELDLNLSRYIEALLRADNEQPEAPLCIYPEP